MSIHARWVSGVRDSLAHGDSTDRGQYLTLAHQHLQFISTRQRTAMVKLDVDLSKPRYDMSTYAGRARHFFEVTDFRLAMASEQVRCPLSRSILPRFCHPCTCDRCPWRVVQPCRSLFATSVVASSPAAERSTCFGHACAEFPERECVGVEQCSSCCD